MPQDRNRYPDTYMFPWQASLKNRYSKRLVAVAYFDNEKEAKEYVRSQAGKPGETDFIGKVKNIHP